MPPFENNNSTSYTTLIEVFDGGDKIRTGIYIDDQLTPEDATLSTLKKMCELAIRSHNNSSVDIGKIDGKDGLIVSYPNTNQSKQNFFYLYWPDSEKVPGSDVSIGAIKVRVFGSMPANSSHGMAIAEGIRNTLHIEKSEAPSAPGVESAATSVAPAVEPVIMQTVAPAPTVASAVRPYPYIRTHNQDAASQRGSVIIDEAFSDGPGWLVLFNERYDPYSGPSHSPAGKAHLDDGLNKNIAINVNMARLTPKFYAVLYKDEGVMGEFEFSGRDTPFNPRAIYSFSASLPYANSVESPDWLSYMSSPGRDWL
jgi:hypothetical protein